MKSGVYIIRNLVNGKVYIGSSIDIDKRFKSHIKQLENNQHQSKFQRAWNKYGKRNFQFDVLELLSFNNDNINEFKLKLLEREQHFLDSILFASEKSKKFNKLGYNICRIAGSTLGATMSDEFKKFCSERNNKLWSDKEFRNKQLKNIENGMLSKKSRTKRSNTIKNKKIFEGDRNPMFGTNLYEIWSNKFGKEEANKRRKLKSNRISDKISGNKRPDLSKINKDLKSKIILQYKDNILIEEFSSVKEASEKTGINKSNIANVARGIKNSAGGYIWKYKI